MRTMLCVAAALLASCSGESGPPTICDRIGDPNYNGEGHGVIGPAGGTVQGPSWSVTAGVRVEVTPGAWTQCQEVRVQYEGIFDTPDYPDGYVPFERPYPSGSVRIEIGQTTDKGFVPASASLPIKISFPMNIIHPKALATRAAFFYDDGAKTWRIAFSNEMTADRMAITTSAWDKLWSWGSVDMTEVDFDQHLAPAYRDFYGASTWDAMQAAILKKYEEAKQNQWRLDCASIQAAATFFLSGADVAYARVDAIQKTYGCGSCNPLSKQYQEGLYEYSMAQAKLDMIFSVTDMFPMKKVVELAMIPVQMGVEKIVIDRLGLACDYECFAMHAIPDSGEIGVYSMLYRGCNLLGGFIIWYGASIGC